MTFFSWKTPRSLNPINLGLDRESVMGAPAHSSLRVPREYLPLYQYLEHRYASLVVLTFEQIESLLGFALPETAITDGAWWTGESAASPQTGVWRSTGRQATPNLLAGNVAFERVS